MGSANTLIYDKTYYLECDRMVGSAIFHKPLAQPTIINHYFG